MHLSPGVVHNFKKSMDIIFLRPMHKSIQDTYLKIAGKRRNRNDFPSSLP